MESHVEDKLLLIMKRLNKSFKITVSGISMNPILFEGDVITIEPSRIYNAGDLLVYKYEDKKLLVHRLLFIKNKKYYCKGDNSFRLEEVESEQIFGKVVAFYRNNHMIEMPNFTHELIELSLEISRIFCDYNYDIEKTKKTRTYNKYKQLISNLK